MNYDDLDFDLDDYRMPVKDYWKEGYDAYFAGIKQSECPYKDGTQAGIDWFNAWMEAYEEAQSEWLEHIRFQNG